jgi:hypothetical protein
MIIGTLNKNQGKDARSGVEVAVGLTHASDRLDGGGRPWSDRF